jgi:hypothetical protein
MPGPQRPADYDQPFATPTEAIPNGRAVAAIAALARSGVRHDRKQAAPLAGHVLYAHVHLELPFAQLRPIVRRMRQRLLVFVDPHPITHVDIAAAERAPEIMLSLSHWRPADLPADHGAAQSWFVDWHDRHLITSKESGLGITPEARFPYSAAHIRPGAIDLLCFANDRFRRCPHELASWRPMRRDHRPISAYRLVSQGFQVTLPDR